MGVFKPIETGVDDIPVDANLLLLACQKYNPRFATLSAHDITAYTFGLPAAPYCADEDSVFDMSYMMKRYEELLGLCDILLIEGAGGLMVPISSDVFMIDLIEKFDARALLVTPSRLGCINETLLSLEAMDNRGIKYEWCVNLHEDVDAFMLATKPYYDRVYPKWWSVETDLEKYINKELK